MSGTVLAQALFLGEDLLAWVVLALGAAMLVGNALALVRPPPAGSASGPSRSRSAPGAPGKDAPAGRPPLARTLVMMGIGAIAAVWAIATLAGA